MAAEPGKRKGSGGGGGSAKQRKNTTALQAHLRKIGDRINIITRRVSGSWSDAELSLINAVGSLIQEAIQNNSATNLVTIRTIVAEFDLEGLGLDDIYSELMALLTAKLPDQVVPGVSVPEPTAEVSEPSPGGSRRRKRNRALPPDGSTVLVTLLDPKAKGRIAKILKSANGSKKLTLTGAGADTVSFVVTHKGVKSTTAAIERSQVDIQIIERVSEPDEIGPQMLIEVQWDPDPKYYTVRYSPGLNEDVFVSEDVAEPTEEQIYPFDENEDEWRFPEYPSFSYGDEIQVLTINGFRNATITDVLDTDHTYVCEYDSLLQGETKSDKQFELDIWYQQARDRPDEVSEKTSAAADESGDSDYSVPEEEEAEEPLYDLNDSVEYHGERFKIVNIDSNDDGYMYTLKPREGEEIQILESALEEQWIPRFQNDSEVVYKNAIGIVTAINYANGNYEIQLEENDTIVSDVSEEDLEDLPILAYAPGTPVFYNFGLCTVVRARMTYTLRTSQGSEVGGITDNALHDWFLFINPQTSVQTIYKIVRRKQKSISRKGGKEKKLYYEVVDSNGRKKDIMASSPNIKEQEDAVSFFEDSLQGEGSLEERIIFKPGDRVIIYKSTGDISGIIVNHNSTDNIDDETYDIEVDGEISTYSVEEFGPIEEGLSQPESEDDEFTVNDEELEASSSSDSEDDEDDEEEESEFNVGDYVNMGNSTDVYVIKNAVSNIYEIESAWDDSEPNVQGVAASNLAPFTPEFEEKQPVMHLDDVRVIREVHEDGTYVLDNGEEVTENELQEYVEILPNGTIVRCVGNREVYKITGHQSCGNYKLTNIFTGEKRLEVDQDVIVHEEPEYEVGEFVEMADGISREVKSFKKSNWSYKLEGIDRQVPESDLVAATYEPEFSKGDEVVFDGEVYTIKTVIRSRKSYLLNNGAEVKEELLSSTED